MKKYKYKVFSIHPTCPDYSIETYLNDMGRDGFHCVGITAILDSNNKIKYIMEKEVEND